MQIMTELTMDSPYPYIRIWVEIFLSELFFPPSLTYFLLRSLTVTYVKFIYKPSP